MSVPLANDLVLLIISVLLSFGLMDFKCGGVDLSMLCDKRSWSPGPAHEPSLRRDGFGRTNKPFNHRFCSWAQKASPAAGVSESSRAETVLSHLA